LGWKWYRNIRSAAHQLCVLVREEVEELRQAGKEIPIPATRAMREAVLV